VHPQLGIMGCVVLSRKRGGKRWMRHGHSTQSRCHKAPSLRPKEVCGRGGHRRAQLHLNSMQGSVPRVTSASNASLGSCRLADAAVRHVTCCLDPIHLSLPVSQDMSAAQRPTLSTHARKLATPWAFPRGTGSETPKSERQEGVKDITHQFC
jgi:hypothetical protein